MPDNEKMNMQKDKKEKIVLRILSICAVTIWVPVVCVKLLVDDAMMIERCLNGLLLGVLCGGGLGAYTLIANRKYKLVMVNVLGFLSLVPVCLLLLLSVVLVF